MTTTIRFEVSHGQIAVFASSLSEPFNDWSDRHVAQGFAWRPQSVSFRTIQSDGPLSAQVSVVKEIGEVAENAVRAIEVPFDVPADGAVEIGSIADTVPMELPAGQFLLRCEFFGVGPAGDQEARLIFSRSRARFAVLIADEEIVLAGELLKTAQPARS